MACLRRLVLGDIILGINGKKIDSASDLYRILDKASVGDQVRTVLPSGHLYRTDLRRTLGKTSAVGEGRGAVQGGCPPRRQQQWAAAQPGMHAGVLFSDLHCDSEAAPAFLLICRLQLDVEVLRLDSKQHVTITLEASA